jgi:hypothetical protein
MLPPFCCIWGAHLTCVVFAYVGAKFYTSHLHTLMTDTGLTPRLTSGETYNPHRPTFMDWHHVEHACYPPFNDASGGR